MPERDQMDRSTRRSGSRHAHVGVRAALAVGTKETLQYVDEVERVTGARVSLIATGFMPNRGIIDRRLW